MPQPKHAPRRLAALLIGVAILPMPSVAAGPQTDEVALTQLIREQTEEFSRAGKAGDHVALDRLLDRDVVFMNEDGSMPTRQELIDGASPATEKFQLVVTDFKLRPQGDVATATFVDVLTEDFHGLSLSTNFHSTEVWKRRGSQWRMIASQTTTVPHDPPPVTLTAAEIDQYVGEYQLSSSLRTRITRDGDNLYVSSNGGQKRQLLAEFKDVLFIPGLPFGRRFVQRDASGRVAGYVINANGNDVMLRKVT